ncbi:MFS transporter [Paenibacillus donghaensis]|uniref:MFS transporter n=1 Tax=Paenibacillus donghaensis TaxID=414771 RepID=A0A2Z2KHL7_9BACL|nr:MFS transporter [Paenibacillus donghaensis]ASA26306.1 MFS transporter [Paenibacillus donghaensis]
MQEILPKQRKAALLVVALAVFTDMMIYGIVVPILPQYSASLGANPTQIGLLFGSYGLALLLASPLFGMLSDRIGRKGPLLWGLLGLAATTLLFLLADSFWPLVAARALQGVSAAATWTAGLALIADLYPAAERGKAMGLALSGQAAGTLLGPAAGGWLYQWGGYAAPFIFVAGLTLADAVLRIVLLRKVPDVVQTEPHRLGGILRSRSLLLVFGVVILGSSIPAVLEPTLPLRLKEVFGLSPGGIGLLFMIPTAAYGLIAPFAGSLSGKIGNFPLIRVGLAITAVALPLNALGASLWLQALTLAMLGIGMGTILSPSLPELALAAEQSGVRSYGVVFSVYNTAYSAGMMVGPLMAGLLTDYFGIQSAYIAVGIILLAYLLLTVLQASGTRAAKSAREAE